MECTAGFGAGATAGSGYHDLLICQPFVVTTVEVGHRRFRLPLMRMPGDGSSARRGGATCGQSCANKPEPRWVARWLVQVLLRQQRLIEEAGVRGDTSGVRVRVWRRVGSSEAQSQHRLRKAAAAVKQHTLDWILPYYMGRFQSRGLKQTAEDPMQSGGKWHAENRWTCAANRSR